MISVKVGQLFTFVKPNGLKSFGQAKEVHDKYIVADCGCDGNGIKIPVEKVVNVWKDYTKKSD